MSLALAGFSAQSIRANEVLMDLDDADGHAEVVHIVHLAATSPQGLPPSGSVSTALICGGMDDDQVTGTDWGTDVMKAISKLDQLDERSLTAILTDMLHGDDGNDTLQTFALWEALTKGPSRVPGIESDQFGIYGEGGADSITGDLGNDTLYGGSGADTVRQLARYVTCGFTGDPMEEDAITGDGADDIFHPSDRMMRLQEVARFLGLRDDLRFLSGVINHSFAAVGPVNH